MSKLHHPNTIHTGVPENIGQARLASQHVGGSRFTTVKDLVSWMGAIQAQDINSSLWAIGVRLPGSKAQMVYDAFEKGEIIRTHILRPTWHIVAAEDYGDFMALTAPYIRPSLHYRRSELGLDDALFSKSNPALKEMLANGNHLTREQITVELSTIIPQLDSSKMNHILMEAEMNCLICSGRIIDRKGTYALVSEMLPGFDPAAPLNREGALKRMALKYFSSHGPATLSDFNWWSGMPMGECRKALDLAKENLATFAAEGVEYWYDSLVSPFYINLDDGSVKEKTLVDKNANWQDFHLLPAYDEFLIAYRDRSAVITREGHVKAISSNGIFRPVVVYKGKVAGLWSMKGTGAKKSVDIKLFDGTPRIPEKAVKEAVKRVNDFR